MKKGILFLLLTSSVVVNAQSLKDALYGGKLKNDSGSVVHKSDDLSTKIDTTKKKIVEADKTKIAVATKDSAKSSNIQADAAKTTTVIKDTVASTAPARSNTQLWKQYIDSASAKLKREGLTDKRIKSGTYYILVDYDINEDGQVSITNATPDPMDRNLQEQVREVLEASAPKLNPTISNGKPKKVSKKYNFILTKD